MVKQQRGDGRGYEVLGRRLFDLREVLRRHLTLVRVGRCTIKDIWAGTAAQFGYNDGFDFFFFLKASRSKEG